MVQTSGAPIESATAIIESAGTVDITGSQQIENGFIRPGIVYAAGAAGARLITGLDSDDAMFRYLMETPSRARANSTWLPASL